jgi:predicted TIM-barrel fold metal-dependent hydrolase
MIVDFHVHALPPAVKNNRQTYVEKDPAFAAIYSGEKVKIATADDLIDSMDREGIDFSVIVNYQWSTHELCVETNDYILEAINRYPQRLAGFCAVATYHDDKSLAEVERCAQAGARGIGEIRPDLQPPEVITSETLAPLGRLIERYQLILLTHSSEPVGHIYPGKGGATPERLYSFITKFTDAPIVCAHWGGGLPFYTLMPEVRKALENVYYDTAISPFLYRPEIYRHVRDLVGADRIIFGSDYPVISPSRLLKEIEPLEISEEDRELILSGNARRLLRL